MARGLAKMMGFEHSVNFNLPYFQIVYANFGLGGTLNCQIGLETMYTFHLEEVAVVNYSQAKS